MNLDYFLIVLLLFCKYNLMNYYRILILVGMNRKEELRGGSTIYKDMIKLRTYLDVRVAGQIDGTRQEGLQSA